MLRFSLATLLGVILFVSLGLAALANASLMWEQAAVSLTLLVLLAAMVAALFGPERRRTFCRGYALVGGAYFLLATLPAFAQLRSQLLTTEALSLLHAAMQNDPAPSGEVQLAVQDFDLAYFTAQSINIQTGQPIQYSVATSGNPHANAHQFISIGHMLWGLMLGWLGGVLAIVAGCRVRSCGTESERRRADEDS